MSESNVSFHQRRAKAKQEGGVLFLLVVGESLGGE